MWGKIFFIVLVIGGIILLFPLMIGLLIFLPMFLAPQLAHTASVQLQSPRAEITVELYSVSHLTEYERFLIIKTPTETLKVKMELDWGPARRTSLYRINQNHLAVLGPASDNYFLSINPLKSVKDKNWNSAEWTYLGVFDFANGRARDGFYFFAPERSKECIPLLGSSDTGIKYRRPYYKEEC